MRPIGVFRKSAALGVSLTLSPGAPPRLSSVTHARVSTRAEG